MTLILGISTGTSKIWGEASEVRCQPMRPLWNSCRSLMELSPVYHDRAGSASGGRRGSPLVGMRGPAQPSTRRARKWLVLPYGKWACSLTFVRVRT
eukprot:scaffold3372_cov248-Prasinococcus_capsulatus_cf.AAC.4